MDVVMLKTVCKNLSNFEEATLDVDFVTDKRVFEDESDSNTVTHLFNNIYKLNTLAFTGINATGKTTVLNILSAVLNMYVGNKSLEYDSSLSRYFEETLEIETYFYQKEKNLLYKLNSTIRKNNAFGTLYFEDETLFSKKATTQVNKGNLYDFSDEHIKISRAGFNNEFLKAEDSIFSGIMNERGPSSGLVVDMCASTNNNTLSNVSLYLMMPFANYLDPSIESIRFFKTIANPSLEIKFKNNPELVTVKVEELDKYLSSGTIKGISCFSNIATVLMSGGYLIVDEIENHLNKTIVIGIINMFTSTLNENGATLLFSSHYSELLDSIDRSDGIYLLSKADKMRVRKFSAAASNKDRKDKKRSDLVLSGALDSAPSYQSYRKLVDSLDRFLHEKAEEKGHS